MEIERYSSSWRPAYQKIGDVQGEPSGSNIGDAAGALASYQRAEQILQGLAAGGDTSARRGLAAVYAKLAAFRMAHNESKAAREYYDRAWAICQPLLERAPRDRELLTLAGQMQSDRARELAW